MKRNLFRVGMFLFFLTVVNVHGQSADSLFVEANKLYQNENTPEEALQVYADIEKQNIVSYELYYNIANTYYKTNQVAESIYYYEKALQLKPNDEDVLFNLDFANKK
ncbi:MAG: tetratricopeptide repeat protein [Flavobacteriaceae bacterium]|nr:tetratricopeptide repeat protein [Flavobacteriaceae bacterium]